MESWRNYVTRFSSLLVTGAILSACYAPGVTSTQSEVVTEPDVSEVLEIEAPTFESTVTDTPTATQTPPPTFTPRPPPVKVDMETLELMASEWPSTDLYSVEQITFGDLLSIASKVYIGAGGSEATVEDGLLSHLAHQGIFAGDKYPEMDEIIQGPAEVFISTKLDLTSFADRISPPEPTVTPTPTITPDYSTLGNPIDPFYHPRDWIPVGFLEHNDTDFYIDKRNMHNREVTIAFEKDVPLTSQQREIISEFSLKIWGEWWEIFQGFPWAYYTIVIRKNPRRSPAGELGIGWEDDASHLKNKGKYEEVIGHQIFHAWWVNCVEHESNHRDPETPEMWSSEGFTQYYGDRAGGPAVYNQWMNMHWSDYQRMVGSKYDVPLLEMGSYAISEGDDEYFRKVYWKGALVAYMIDVQLIKEGKNLDHLMRYMYDNYCLTRRRYKNEDVLNALESITEIEWGVFFEKYIYGIDKLPLDGDFVFLEH